ncbi:MAG: chemotaxis protein CheW [Gammaproteobacteria bacterium]|nr:chemotaxis protein CheW [Gammaproteobacteria bacterium]
MSDLVASQKVMRSYLNALLTEDVEPEVSKVVAEVQKQQLNQLLSTVKPPFAKPAVVAPTVAKAAPVAPTPVAPVVTKPVAPPVVAKPVVPEVIVAKPVVPVVKTPVPPVTPPATPVAEYRQGKFQALFFEVAGLKVALPLKELGGIHKMGPLNHLPGKPAWYRGVMLYRDQKINVVNTAMWVMPEKYDQALAEKLNYQYVIMLGKSSWGLACESLINTVTLEQDDVKWRSAEGKRPWLAGLIKQHMCALLDVDAMVALLAAGADSSD